MKYTVIGESCKDAWKVKTFDSSTKAMSYLRACKYELDKLVAYIDDAGSALSMEYLPIDEFCAFDEQLAKYYRHGMKYHMEIEDEDKNRYDF